MTYRINGVELSLQPEEGKWVNRDILGLDGNGRALYPSMREYELRWSLMSAASYAELMGLYNALDITGSAVVDLPQFGATPYAFYSYSGCALQEPMVDRFFAEHVTNVVLVITNIQT